MLETQLLLPQGRMTDKLSFAISQPTKTVKKSSPQQIEPADFSDVSLSSSNEDDDVTNDPLDDFNPADIRRMSVFLQPAFDNREVAAPGGGGSNPLYQSDSDDYI